MRSYLGPTRLRILLMVVDGRRRNKPYTIDEIKEALGFASKNGVHKHLEALRLQGLVTWNNGSGRTLTPLVEFVPAGQLGGTEP